MNAHRSPRSGRDRSGLAHAVRVAAAATAVIAALYVVVVGVFDVVVIHRQQAQVDGRLADRLGDLVRHPAEAPVAEGGLLTLPADRGDADVDGAPVYLWQLSSQGRVLAAAPGAPALPRGGWWRAATPTTHVVSASQFRLRAEPFSGGYLVVGLNVAEQLHLQSLLITGEVVAGPVLLLAMFLGSLLIGRRAAAPVELARRRQLEFTADASHELRTPLSVIEAEVDLALGRERPGPDYRQALDRVGREARRLRRIVDDLLWLARFDSTPPPPPGSPVDLESVAHGSVRRFGALAQARHLELSVRRVGQAPAWVDAPPEWVERLVGVLVDNACRYTPEGGTVEVAVETRGGRVSLVVQDSGPGIEPAGGERLFDRFHRDTDAPGGTGLGLAIADSVVRSTAGRWQLSRSTRLGGAGFEVSWHRGPGRSVGQGDPGVGPGAHLPQQQQAQGDADGDAGRQHPLAQPGAGNR